MRILVTPSNPKGGLLSLTKRAIIAHVKSAGRCSFVQLCEAFKEPCKFNPIAEPVDSRVKADTDAHWLRAQLNALRHQGHLVRVVIDNFTWYEVGSEIEAACEATAPDYSLVPPRQVHVMGTPVYSPPKAAPCRAGALDFASRPSLHAGQEIAYKTSLEACNG